MLLQLNKASIFHYCDLYFCITCLQLRLWTYTIIHTVIFFIQHLKSSDLKIKYFKHSISLFNQLTSAELINIFIVTLKAKFYKCKLLNFIFNKFIKYSM